MAGVKERTRRSAVPFAPVKNRVRPLALLVALSLALAACGGDDDPSGAQSTRSGSDVATPNGEEPGAETPSDDPSATTSRGGKAGSKATTTSLKGSTNKSGGGSTTRTTLESDLGPPQDPGPFRSPAGGEYIYSAYRASPGHEMEKATRPFRVTIKPSAAGGGVAAFEYEIRNEVSTNVSHQHYLFKSTTIEFDKQVDKGAVCDWVPDMNHLALPMAVGSTWSAKTSCTMQTGPATVTRKVNESSKISRWGRVKVGSTVVDCYVVERETVIDATYVVQGETRKTHTEVSEKEWIAAAQGLVARETMETTTRVEGKDERYMFERVLDSLAPRSAS